MNPLIRAAVVFLVLAGQGAVGQVVTRTQVPEVRLNVGPVAPAVNLSAGSGALGTMNSGMSFSGSVLSLRGGRIQEAPPDLPASAVPSLSASGVPGAGVALPLPGGGALPAPGQPFPQSSKDAGQPEAGGPRQSFKRQALDPEDPAMGQGSRGRLAGDVSEESSSAEFPEKAEAISRHLKDAGQVSEQGSEFAEGFGRRLAELMVGSREHRSGGSGPPSLADQDRRPRRRRPFSARRRGPEAPEGEPFRARAVFRSPEGAGGLEDGGLLVFGGVSALAGGVGLAAAGRPAGSPLDAVPSSEPGPSPVPDEGFPGVGRVLMEVSALTLELSQVFPAGLDFLAAKASAGAVRPLDGPLPIVSGGGTPAPETPGAVSRRPWSSAERTAGASLALIEETVVPAPISSVTDDKSDSMPSAYDASDPDLAYPGGFGSFMASVGNAMATEGRGGIEYGTFVPLELKAAHAVREGASSETPASSSDRLPSAPLALLSYVLLPLFLAGLELRSRI